MRRDEHAEDRAGAPETIPISKATGPAPSVYYASFDEEGRVTEHRVFDQDPRPTCALCVLCKAHLEKDGRYYCDRRAKCSAGASPLPWCSA